jgi:YD repeat-containing protein
MCTHDLLVVTADGRGFQLPANGKDIRQGFSARFAEPRVVKSSEDYMREMSEEMMARSGNAVRQDMKPGQSKWYVGTIGMPGQERVISAAREEWFEEGRSPTVASVEQALIKKYGEPTRSQHWDAGSVALTWAYDPMGRRISETSPLYNSCTGVSSPDGGANFSPDCGIVVAASIYPLAANRELGQMMQVGVVDQASGYEGLQAVEQTLQSQDAQRKAQEVKNAQQNADVPDL